MARNPRRLMILLHGTEKEVKRELRTALIERVVMNLALAAGLITLVTWASIKLLSGG